MSSRHGTGLYGSSQALVRSLGFKLWWGEPYRGGSQECQGPPWSVEGAAGGEQAQLAEPTFQVAVSRPAGQQSGRRRGARGQLLGFGD